MDFEVVKATAAGSPLTRRSRKRAGNNTPGDDPDRPSADADRLLEVQEKDAQIERLTAQLEKAKAKSKKQKVQPPPKVTVQLPPAELNKIVDAVKQGAKSGAKEGGKEGGKAGGKEGAQLASKARGASDSRCRQPASDNKSA